MKQGSQNPAAPSTSKNSSKPTVFWTGVCLFVLALTLAVAILMVSNVPYRSFKDFDLRSHVPFVVLIGVVTVLVVIVYDPPRVLFAGFFLYVLSGPVLALVKRRRGNKTDNDT